MELLSGAAIYHGAGRRRQGALAVVCLALIWSPPLGAVTVTGGAQLRSDALAHNVRVELGVGTENAEVVAVADPWVLTDGQHDADLRLQLALGRWFGAVGWRSTSVVLSDGSYWQHRLLVGLMADVVRPWEPVAVQAGLEISALMAQHGAGGATRLIPARGSASLGESLGVGVVLRIYHAATL